MIDIKKIEFFRKYELRDIKPVRHGVDMLTDQGIFSVKVYENEKMISLIKSRKEWLEDAIKIEKRINPILCIGTSDHQAYSIRRKIIDNKNHENLEVQFEKGKHIGAFLRKFHEKTHQKDTVTWPKIYNYKINLTYYDYNMSSFRGDKDYILFDFIRENRYLLDDREISNILHVNSLSNILIDSEGTIDFDLSDQSYLADPIFEFRNISTDCYDLKGFYYGVLYGYYQGRVPRKFYKMLALYTVVEVLNNIYKKESKDETVIKMQVDELIELYDNFSVIKPQWILECEEELGV